MASVWIPALMRDLTGQQASVQVDGSTVRELIDALEAKFPGIRGRLCRGNELRREIFVVIDEQIERGGLDAVVRENNEVHFIPAVGGGTSPLAPPWP